MDLYISIYTYMVIPVYMDLIGRTLAWIYVLDPPKILGLLESSPRCDAAKEPQLPPRPSIWAGSGEGFHSLAQVNTLKFHLCAVCACVFVMLCTVLYCNVM